MREIKGNLLMYLKLRVSPDRASLALIGAVFARLLPIWASPAAAPRSTARAGRPASGLTT
jgi:hypothetical protein